jgi:hypothetical protein
MECRRFADIVQPIKPCQARIGQRAVAAPFWISGCLVAGGLGLPNCLPRRNRAYPMFNGQADRFSPQRHAAVFRLPFGCRADGV